MTGIVRALVVSGLALLLGGCGAIQMAYNNVDVLIRYKARDYVELSAEQREAFRTRLARLHQWHRREELPRYADLLAETGRRVGRGLTVADVNWAMQAYRERYGVLVHAALAEAVPIARTLSPPQIDDAAKRLAAANVVFAKERHVDDPPRRVRHATTQMVRQFSHWLGDLTDEQEALITAFVRSQDALWQWRMPDRERRQRQGIDLLRSARDPALLQEGLAEFLLRSDRGRVPEYSSALERFDAEFQQLLLAIDKSATSDQRARALRRINDYAEDLRTLMRTRAAEAGS
jgi:hypothetical protein